MLREHKVLSYHHVDTCMVYAQISFFIIAMYVEKKSNFKNLSVLQWPSIEE